MKRCGAVLVSVSPCLRVSVSPCLRIPVSPISLSPYPPVWYNRHGPVGTAHPGSPRQNAAGRGTATILTTTTATTTTTVFGCVWPIAGMFSLLWHPAAPLVAPSAAEGADRWVCSRASERDLAQAVGAGSTPASSQRTRRPAGQVTANAANARRGGITTLIHDHYARLVRLPLAPCLGHPDWHCGRVTSYRYRTNGHAYCRWRYPCCGQQHAGEYHPL